MNPESPRPSKWGKVGKVAMIIFVVLLCIVGVAYSLTDIGPTAGSYEKNRQAAMKARVVFDKETAAPLFEIPANDNAAPTIAEALKSIEPFQKATNDTKQSDQEFVKTWAKIQASFLTIEQGCKKNHLLFPHDYSTPVYGPTPEFTWVRYWVRAMIRRAKIASSRDEHELGERLLVTAAKLASMVDDYPELLALHVRLSTSIEIEQTLQLVLSERGNDPKWQSAISNTLTVLDKPYDLRPALKREHWSAVSLVNVYMGKEPDAFNSLGELGHEVKLVRLIPRMEKALLSRIHEYYAFAINSYPTDPSDYQALEILFKNLYSISDRQGLSMIFSPYNYLFLGQDFVLPLVAEEAQRNALRQALEIVRQKQNPAHGLPLPGRKALDVDDKPLRMKKAAAGWIIYSIGTNQVDEGGIETSKYQGDFIVHLPKNP